MRKLLPIYAFVVSGFFQSVLNAQTADGKDSLRLLYYQKNQIQLSCTLDNAIKIEVFKQLEQTSFSYDQATAAFIAKYPKTPEQVNAGLKSLANQKCAAIAQTQAIQNTAAQLSNSNSSSSANNYAYPNAAAAAQNIQMAMPLVAAGVQYAQASRNETADKLQQSVSSSSGHESTHASAQTDTVKGSTSSTSSSHGEGSTAHSDGASSDGGSEKTDSNNLAGEEGSAQQSNDALKKAGLKNEGDSTLDPKNAENLDPHSEQAIKNAEQAAEQLQANMTEFSTTYKDCGAAELSKELENVKKEKLSCEKKAETSHNWCSFARSEKAKAVSTLMSASSLVLSQVDSAAASCGLLGNVLKVGQSGLLLMNAACAGVKAMCDSTCLSVAKNLDNLKSKVGQMQVEMLEKVTPRVAAKDPEAIRLKALCSTMSANFEAKIGVQQKQAIQIRQAECKQHSESLARIALQVTALGVSMAQAKDCKKKLSTSSGSQAVMTTEQMCGYPEFANNLVCKCKSNPSAEGCPGAVAKTTTSSDNPAGLNLKNTGSGSQAVGVNGFKQNPSIGLSDEAKSALGISNESGAAETQETSASTTPFGSASSQQAVSGAGVSNNDELSKTAATESAQKYKFNYGGFYSPGSSGLGGRGAASGVDSKAFSADQLEAAKRKLASDQLQAEVSQASGKSNWEKVRERYLQNRSSLLGN